MASLSQGLEPRGVKGVLVTTLVLENQVSHCSPKSQMWGLSLGAFGSVAVVTTNDLLLPVQEKLTWGLGSQQLHGGGNTGTY